MPKILCSTVLCAALAASSAAKNVDPIVRDLAFNGVAGLFTWTGFYGDPVPNYSWQVFRSAMGLKCTGVGDCFPHPELTERAPL